MATIKPKSEKLKMAVKWIAEQEGEKSSEAGKDKEKIIQEACFKFNLSPNDAEFLENFMQSENE